MAVQILLLRLQINVFTQDEKEMVNSFFILKYIESTASHRITNVEC